MPTTPLGIAYPTETEAPDVTQLAELATTADAAIVATRDLWDTPWNTYTPGWTSGLNGPSLAVGNGTLEGRWKKVGLVGLVTVALQRGSTTNVGTVDPYVFTLPAEAQPLGLSWVTGAAQYGTATANTTYYPGAVNGLGGLNVTIIAATGGRLSGTNPGSWTSAGWIRFTAIYPTAA